MIKKKYFENLDGLRFIAALTVAISHLETIKSHANVYYVNNRFFENSAQLAVTFFFVLSGFLITWWFLEDTKGNLRYINIRLFYINRISRTWPLYFFIVLFSLSIGLFNNSYESDSSFTCRFVRYFFFMPNSADLNCGADIYLGQTWSLAVEEFFYILFPLFLINVKRRYLFHAFILMTLFFLLASSVFNPIFFNLFYKDYSIPQPLGLLITFFERYRMYSFLLGGLTALIVFYRGSYVQDYLIGKWKKASVLLVIFTSFLYLFGITFSFLNHQIYSVLFSFIILFFVCSDRSYMFLNNKIFSWGGKISYGIYMLHMFVVMRLVNQGKVLFDFKDPTISVLTSWIILFLIVFIVSHLSYKYFERPILKSIRRLTYLKKGE